MARHKDCNWSLPEGTPNPRGDGTLHEHDNIVISLLMDLRDEMKLQTAELKKLNGLLCCPNFTAIPRVLTAIRRNTNKPKVKP